jgi:mono/diheme cytochrome c family protein
MSDWRRAWVALALCFLCAPSFSQQGAQTTALARGQYLARMGNCVSCHSRSGGDAFAGGVAFETPYGRLYSTNITQDPQAGIGSWTLAQFSQALREGVRPDGTHLYPAFPYPEFTKVSDADVAALYAFLKTIPPSKSVAPANELRFPYNQRWALGLWKDLYFTAGRYTPDAAKSAEWNRGAYLVQGLGHCGECHTPRGALGALNTKSALQGAVYRDTLLDRVVDWSSVNLTAAATGLKSWSAQDMADYLRLGLSPRAGVFGPMNEVIMNSTRYLSDRDARAIAVYLKSLPGPASSSSSASGDLGDGETLYGVHCATCHLPTGLGGSDTGPPLAGSAVVQADDPASLINITLAGELVPKVAPSPQFQSRQWQAMTAFADKLTDEDMAALLTYVRASFGNHGSAVTAAQVAKQR